MVAEQLLERAPDGHVLRVRGVLAVEPLAVLDSVTDECGAEFCSEGSIDDTQFRWVERELEHAAMAGEYVLAFAHHTLRTTRQATTDLTEAPIH